MPKRISVKAVAFEQIDSVSNSVQASLSMGFSRQEYWSGMPFPPPGDFPDSGIEPVSSALVRRFFTTEPPGKTNQLRRSVHKAAPIPDTFLSIKPGSPFRGTM